jgi:single-strand DNA-binding protein
MLTTNETWTHLGKSQERVDWHRVVFLSEGLIACVEECVRNGSLIYVEGKLQVRKYKDAAGAEQVSIEVVVNHPHGCLQMVRPGVRGSMEGQALTYDRVFPRADVPAA